MDPTLLGLTVQLHVSDIDAAARWYGALFGRGPDFAPHEDFLEWRVVDTVEVWVQVVEHPDPQPLTTRLRFRVGDVQSVCRTLPEAVGTPTPVTELPGVVAFADLTDPWGNELGFYTDLVPSAEQNGPGGSVHDDRHFRPADERGAPVS